MYQEVLGSRVSEPRRVEWQGRIAAREEQAYGAHVRDIAAQLAVRFEAARRYDRGVKYLELAARNALSGNAYIEADRLYGKAIDMLPLAQLDDPAKVELRMLLPRSVAVIVTQGYATDEIEKIHHRALQLARERGDQPAVVRVLHSIWTTYVAQGQLHKARSTAIEISDHAELTSDTTALLQAHAKLGQTSFQGTGARRGLPRLGPVVSRLPRCRLPHGPRIAADGPHAQGPLRPRVRPGLRRLGAFLPRRARRGRGVGRRGL
jgi:hypothetical protein